jgi:uncharacterized protein (TIGR03437 family)
MARYWLVLGVLAAGISWAQAPAYTADDIVNASDYSPAPFAPNSVLSIFGSNLSWYAVAMSATTVAAPTSLGGVTVYVNGLAAPLLYVSGPQINFLIPSMELIGNVTVRVERQGTSGPKVTITLVNCAPALFDLGTGFAIATHADGTLLSAASPGQPGEIVVVYATGLGYTDPNPQSGEIPAAAATLKWLSSLRVSLGGGALSADRIKYAGVTPGCVGLYQLNIELPQDVPPDPAIQVAVGGRSTSGALKIAVE